MYNFLLGSSDFFLFKHILYKYKRVGCVSCCHTIQVKTNRFKELRTVQYANYYQYYILNI